MNILVTGGAGYIGSHFCKAAAKAGHRPVVVDDLSMGHREFVKWGPFYQTSILDTDRLKNICEVEGVEAVVHFAAKSLVGESVRQPDLYRKINVEGTRSLLGAIYGTKVKYFVFSSSAATYGEPKVDLISEITTQNPVNPYGETKLECEKLLLGQKLYRLAILRYFNVVGQDPEGELHEKHEPETHLVPNILKAMQTGREFGIFGEDYPTPDGTCIRDYVDVNDLALVHLEALNFIQTNDKPLVSNVGRGEGVSIKEVLAAVERVFGKLPTLEIEDRRVGDPARLVASDKIFRGWCKVPLRSLEESLKTLK